MRIRLLFCSILSVLLCAPIVVTVDAVSMWSQTYGGIGSEYARSLVATSDGGYAIAGFTDSFGVESNEFWLIKTDGSGNTQWNKTYGGHNSDFAYSVVETTDGGYVLAGSKYSFNGSDLSYDVLLVKTDSFGNMEWNKTYGGAEADIAYSLVVAPDGGYALAGYTSSYGDGNGDFWLVKTDASGNIEWSRTYGSPKGFESARSIVVTSDGGYALAGGTGIFSAWNEVTGESDFWLVKTDALGNQEWNKTYGGTGADTAYSLIKTPEGGYAIAGSWNQSLLPQTDPWLYLGDCWLVKTDSAGNMEWNQTYGGTGQDIAYSLVAASDGGYAIAGVLNYTDWWNGTAEVYTGDFLLIKTDALGYIEWNQTYGVDGIDEAYSLVSTSDGGYAIAGRTSRPDVRTEAWLIKTDEFGIYPEYTSLLIPALVMTATAFVIVNRKRWKRGEANNGAEHLT